MSTTTPTERPSEQNRTPRLIPPGDLAHYFALHETDPWPATLADVVNDDGRNTQYQALVTRLAADAPETTKASIRESAAYLLGREVGRQAGRGNTRDIPIDLIDRADRLRTLLEFVAGYALLVDACEDGATIDSLKMSFLGIPLLEASDTVQELIDVVQDDPDTPDDKPTAPPAAD